jgi:undecaprenyl-diphosphatase
MNYLQIVVLALIQGLAELLPVSSSAHVIVVEKLMGLDPSRPELTFVLIMLHTGTMFAVIAYFWPRWRPLLLPPAEEKGDRYHFLKMVVVASICTAVLAFILKESIEKVVLARMLGNSKGEVEDLFKSLPLVASGLFAVGVFIVVAGRRDGKIKTRGLDTRSAGVIGIVQAFCLPFRGFSRSGATISTALVQGVARPLAEDFSFALAVVLTPAVIVWELRRLLKSADWQGSQELVALLTPGLVGMVFSFVAGLLALKILSAALERGRWMYFGIYCIVAAAVVGAFALKGI